MSELAKFIAPGRCTCCGAQMRKWDAASMIQAARLWNDRYGSPPASDQWVRATEDHPAKASPTAMFGTWNNFLRAAGLSTRIQGGPFTWTRDDIAAAMLDELVRTGRWPTKRGWSVATNGAFRPNASSVIRQFGSWTAAKRYAGWLGTRKEQKEMLRAA